MASCITTSWITTAPQAKLTVTQTASTATTATLTYKLQYIARDPADCASNRSYTIYINGSSVKSGSYNIDGKVGTYDICSGTVTINKTTSAQSISFKVSFAFNLTWSGVYKGTLSASGSISVAAKTSYTITYDANGGTGAPSAQTKWHGTNITIPSTKPTRTGYSFQGWATSSTGSKAYDPGDSYSGNANATLYAVWKANTYSVTYDANGGTGAPSAQTKTYGTTLKLSTTVPTRTNYTFLGWGTSASATTVVYAAGANYTANAALNLYAIWELTYIKPRISNRTVARCDANGNLTDDGTYALVSFDWETDLTLSSILVSYKLPSEDTYNDERVTASGTSGHCNAVVGLGGLSPDNTYDFRITVTDSNGSTANTVTLKSTFYPIDVDIEGRGIAFGKSVESGYEGYMDVGFKGMLRDHVYLANGKALYGITTDGQLCSLIYMNSSNNTTVGFGGYNNQVGFTNIYGNIVAITSNDDIRFNSPIVVKELAEFNKNVNIAGHATFNDDVYIINNKALFTRSTDDVLCSLIYMNSNNNTVVGYGGYNNNIGHTNVYGQQVNLASKNGIFADGIQLAKNKVLWNNASGYYMNNEQTATLSEAITDQANGIVLIWSWYASGNSSDAEFNMTFIPKQFVTSFGGSGMTCLMASGGLGSFAAKYIYINDTSLKGYTDNNATSGSTSSEIIRSPRSFVLRQVIGV